MSKKHFIAARDTGNNLIAQVKDNQHALHDACRTLCARKPDQSCKTVDDTRRNRLEHRTVHMFHLDKAEKDAIGPEWKDLIAAIACVERQTWRKDTRDGGLYALATETAFHACHVSLDANSAGHAIRQHWGIENRLHHVRDVTLREDVSRIRQKPTRFARIRSFALNILRANNVRNIKAELYQNALKFENIMAYAIA